MSPVPVGVGAARTLVADLDDEPVAVVGELDASPPRRRRAWRRWSAPRRRRSRRRSRRPARGRRMIDAFTVTGICARRPERLDRRRQAAVGQHRRRDAAGEVAQLADGGARLLAGAGARARRPRGWSSRRSSARPSCMLRATSRACAPSCRSRSMRRSSAAWTSSAPRAGARELVDARRQLALLRAQARQGGDDDRVGAERERQRGHRPQRPERAAAGEQRRPRRARPRPSPRPRHGARAPAGAPRAPAARGAPRAGSPAAPRGAKATHLRPEVAGTGQPPDEDQHEAEQQRQRGLDRDGGAPDVIARAIGVHGHSVPGADAPVPGARPRVTLRLAAG